MNKSVHLGLSTIELSKILMYEFWYSQLSQLIQKSYSRISKKT